MPENEAFSNPMAPAHVESEDAQPLTNEDFRKLMMTPRAPSKAAEKDPKPEIKEKDIDENDPGMKRKQKKIYYAKLKRLEEERQKELAGKYRDRATERRSGKTDYEETETISTTADYRAVAPNAQADASYTERRKQLIQESKYLGGDMEHTHLVKGLDYALLEKVRAEIWHKEEETEEIDIEQALEEKEKEPEKDPEEKMEFGTKLGRNIFRTLFKPKSVERNELFIPGRMAYIIELEDEYAETDIPTTTIRSKADIVNTEATTTFTTNDIVISKLTQILSYLRQGKRDRKKKNKEKAKMREEDLKKLGGDDSIYGEIGEYQPTLKKEKDKAVDIARRDRGDRERGDRDRDRHRGDRERDRHRGDRERDRDRGKRSYFEKPVDEDEDRERNMPDGSAKEMVQSINTRFQAQAPQASWTEKFPSADQSMLGPDGQPEPQPTSSGKKKKKKDIDSYAECYPGLDEAYDAYGDSDDEVDYTKMDQGNKKGPVGRWDFDTQEEYSDYMSNKEALPKAAFQYGVKMADGRRTRRTGPKDEKKELDREWQKIQNIISKRKQMGTDGEPRAKNSKYQ